ncbi:transcriptional regulator, AlpA family [Desulfatibacillum alkenivorans DSM 16219]|jgi:excisionase family DNA binding protein|uniref:Transcriptional regulator, AlpA family n=1 Tax=Desulfatibacillum alkenivorans DSM 16219 TaxID=1121393 RepID=A0A1M6W4X8_9BACT|nr:helix-turn-helix domain-containing protein [Desulfatibacillum alkenivorans]SHK88802.1 transcriptional regulator, AlpA family [Desulfatibacillum alkenivorans DSM 16219]
MSGDEIMTIKDVANHLKVGQKTVYTMAQERGLPGFKVRGQWRFSRDDLNQWIKRQKQIAQTAGDPANGRRLRSL